MCLKYGVTKGVFCPFCTRLLQQNCRMLMRKALNIHDNTVSNTFIFLVPLGFSE